VQEHQFELNKMHGLHFSSSDNNKLYGFADKNLYTLNIQENSYKLVKEFDSKIIRIVTAPEDGIQLVVTQTAAYNLNDLSKLTINTDKKILNVMVSEHVQSSEHFIAIGSQWNTKIHYLSFENNSLVVGESVSISYDNNIPFRQWRKSVTTPLGTPSNVGGDMWFSDYWGVYKYSIENERFEEYSLDASNFVGTDIELSDDTLFIASMDNGIVSTSQFPRSDYDFNSVFPRTGADWRMAGHAWSVKHKQGKLYSTISPWNQASDYILAFDGERNLMWQQQLGNYETRRDDKAFWGNSYSRQLVINEEDIFTVRDGLKGGLFKVEAYEDISAHQETEPEPLLPYRQDENNRVFRGLVEYQQQLVSYHIEEQNTLRFTDMNTGIITEEISLPSQLWVFELKNIHGKLFLLGREDRPVIYSYENGEITEVLSRDQASAFLAFNISQNNNMMIASTINWGSKKNSEVLISIDQGKTWKDISCLMVNKSGAVDLEFDNWGEYLYILMHVGGVMQLDVWFLEGFDSCTS
jgi:hypothetical protein